MDVPRLTAPAARKWTRPDEYVEGLVRRRSTRHGYRRPRQRTEPEAPRLLLSTLPFLALLGGLAVMAVAIMIAAWPVHEAAPQRPQPVEHERGVAAKGWFQEAQKEMR
jgi:hypothetical protein